MAILTPREFFEKVLPGKFDPSKAASTEAVILMNITGPNGGNWTIAVKDQKMNVTEGNFPSPDITVRISDSDFMELVSGKLSPISAFMFGKIHFQGNLALGMKLMDIGVI